MILNLNKFKELSKNKSPKTIDLSFKLKKNGQLILQLLDKHLLDKFWQINFYTESIKQRKFG